MRPVPGRETGVEEMPLTIYQMLWIFVLYAVLGWCTEVVFVASNTGKFVNRGFLNGPVCPIYGFGVLLVVLCLTPLRDNAAVLFLGSLILTSLIEFAAGFILEKFFDDKWWDYSGQPFNIKGYVCLKFSLAWGVACVVVMNTIQPLIMHLIAWFPYTAGRIILAACLFTFAADTGITVAGTIHMKKRLRVMDELGAQLKALSDRLGAPLADGALEVREKLDESRQGLGGLKDKFDSGLQELEESREKLLDLAKQRRLVQYRLLKSFPRLQEGRYRENISRIMQYRENRNK